MIVTSTNPCRTGNGIADHLKVCAAGHTFVQSWSIGMLLNLGGGVYKRQLPHHLVTFLFYLAFN